MKHKRAKNGSRGRGFPRFCRIQHLEALLVPVDEMLLHSRFILGVFPRFPGTRLLYQDEVRQRPMMAVRKGRRTMSTILQKITGDCG